MKKTTIIINNRTNKIYVKFIELFLHEKKGMTLLHAETSGSSDLLFDSYEGFLLKKPKNCVCLSYIKDNEGGE